VQTTHRSARYTAALALLGMALNALWPLIANAQPHADFFATEICSVNKSTAGSPVGKLPVQLPVQKHPAVHCVFCASGVCNASLSGTLLTVVAPSSAMQPASRTADSRYKSKDAFLFAESRAPPVFSLL
jgi:hypothetical protein